MRILFLSRTLNVGGAERQLVALARGLRRKGHHVAVAVFYEGGAFEDELRSDGIRVHDLHKRGRWDLSFLAELVRCVRAERPAVLHSYHGANAFAAAVKAVSPSVKVVWGVRTAMTDRSAYDWVTRAAPLLDRLASSLADAVIANSNAARRNVVAKGVNGDKIAVVPNGIDCERFRPDPAGGERLRREWGVPGSAALVGLVARLDPVKNHSLFLHAASRVAADRDDVHFVCVGGGASEYRRRLEQLGVELGLGGRLTWTGELEATSAVYGALDAVVLSSDSESFPNVVAEAMACGRPVVVTDAGDTRLVVGSAGIVAPRGDPAGLARGILDVLQRTRASQDEASGTARDRILRHFSLQAMVDRTEVVLEQVVEGAAVPAPDVRPH
jgi:glycosyltransferase involved in cell wall biosynthesis